MKNKTKFFLTIVLVLATAAFGHNSTTVVNFSVVGTIYSGAVPPFMDSDQDNMQYSAPGLIILDPNKLTMIMANGYGMSQDLTLRVTKSAFTEYGPCFLFHGPRTIDSGTICVVRGGGILAKAYGLVIRL